VAKLDHVSYEDYETAFDRWSTEKNDTIVEEKKKSDNIIEEDIDKKEQNIVPEGYKGEDLDLELNAKEKNIVPEVTPVTQFLRSRNEIAQKKKEEEEERLRMTEEQQKFLNNLDADSCVKLTQILTTFDGAIGVCIKDRFVIFPSTELEAQIRENNNEGQYTRVPDMNHFDIAFCTYSREMIPCGAFLKDDDKTSVWGPMHPEIRTVFGETIEKGLRVALESNMSEQWAVRFVMNDDNPDKSHYVIGICDKST